MRLPTALAFLCLAILPAAAASPRPATDPEAARRLASLRTAIAEVESQDAATRSAVRLGPVPRIALKSRRTVSAQEARHIRQLISALTRISQPDVGLSPMERSGTAGSGRPGIGFAPLDALQPPVGPVSQPHGLRRSAAFRELVSLGPKALPCLLASLQDTRPTALVVTQSNSWMLPPVPVHEIPTNPRNRIEARVAGEAGISNSERTVLTADLRPLGAPVRGTSSNPVAVGDICFIALGQIVGRPYDVIRSYGQYSAVIDSPVRDALLARQVRQIWSSGDPAQALLDSLLIDFSCRFGEPSRSGIVAFPGLASEFQVNAARRLLYYFPRETAALVAARLRGLDAGPEPAPPPGASREQIANAQMKWLSADGVSREDLVGAVTWCKGPEIRKALLDLFQRSRNGSLSLAVLPALVPEHADMAEGWLQAELDREPEDDWSPGYGGPYQLLTAAGRLPGDWMKPLFRSAAKRARSVQRRMVMCNVLQEVRWEWAPELLGPYLSDQRETGGSYAVKRVATPSLFAETLPIRVCDQAAETISRSRTDLHFELLGTHADLDRQIDAIRRQIDPPNGRAAVLLAVAAGLGALLAAGAFLTMNRRR